MADAAAALAAEIAALKRRLAAYERASQLGQTTIGVGEEDLPVLDALEAGTEALAGTADLAEAQLVSDDFQDAAGDFHQELVESSGDLDDRLAQAEDDLAASSDRLDAAEADIIDAFGRADAAQTAASDAASAASAAQTAADNAHSAATDAATAAANAAGIADSKGKALIQSTTPAAADQNAVTLWIDTTGGANTPKRWNGSAWVAVTDKAATDAATAAANAASAASAADSKAQSALSAAGSAQTTANSALTMAGSKGKVFYDTTTPSGTGTAVGDLWRQIDASKNVIAEWYWTGSVWQTSQITTSAISNLDVGKLTVGAAAIQTLVSQKIAASTAAFQTVDVKNLFATSGTLDQAVIDKLWADVVNSREITASMIAVGDFTNLIPNAQLRNGTTGWTVTTGTIAVVTTAAGVPGLKLTKTSGTIEARAYAEWVDCTPGERVRLSYTTEGVWSTGNAAIYAEKETAAGVVSTWNPGTTGASTPGDKAYVVTIPSDAVRVRFRPYISATATSGSYATFSNMVVRRMTGAVLIEDNAVTAQKLESQLVLTSEVIAGNPNGNHAKLDGNGFRVMAPPADGAAPTEVIRLGTDTDDYFGVVGADGNLTASITAEGGIAAKDLDIANSISLGGEDLGSRIDYMPQPLAAWGQVAIDTTTMYVTGAGEIGLFELGWDSDQPAGRDARMYLFNLNNVLIRSTVVGQVGLRLRYTTDGTTPTVNSPVLQYSYGYVGVANGYTSFNINRIIGSNNGNYIRCLVTLWNGASGTASVLKDSNQAYLYSTVTDLGQTRTPTAIASTGGGSNGAAPVTTTKEWKTTGTKSYTGTGASYDYNTGYMYSGLSPAGYGDLRSVAVFPSLTSTLSGATINDIWIYVYYDFWYYGSGGNAAISLHGYSSLPASSPSLSYSMTSTGWPRAAGRWVRLPDSTYAGFKSGSWKGFALGGHGGGYTEYGYAHDARIKIRYTK
ncbi:tail protein [Arthrobacter phage Phives]|uniref:Minor tail protein n=1 Tax=Arthrobacter phage Phives TaxID=2776856 RepID=A0A7M1CP74_9CAUD|nr:tail protein [Arthrobacter phage Phives]QOP65149.1 minor tail protein [Arthrobacter phage Phives]